MLDICSKFSLQFDVKFNATKSVALRFGKRFNMLCISLILSGAKFNFVQSVNYLGIYMYAGKNFKCSIEQAKAKFIALLIACYIEVNMYYLSWSV